MASIPGPSRLKLIDGLARALKGLMELIDEIVASPHLEVKIVEKFLQLCEQLFLFKSQLRSLLYLHTMQSDRSYRNACFPTPLRKKKHLSKPKFVQFVNCTNSTQHTQDRDFRLKQSRNALKAYVYFIQYALNEATKVIK